MKKRDVINEIKSIQSRSEFNSRDDYNSRLNDIENALKEFIEYRGDFSIELLKYIPISTVACFEAFFRSTTKELVDFGEPFSDNVANFNQAKNVKLDFEVVAAIQTKTLTVGELVGHILPYSSFEDINSNISILVGKDFIEELKSFKKKTRIEQIIKTTSDFQSRTDEIIKSVKRTYELRHIFCHEFATNIKIDQEEILKNYKNCKTFLEHCNNVIWEILYPNSPETQTEMSDQTSEKFDLKDRELAKLIDTIKQSSKVDYLLEPFDETLFDNCFNIWKEYRKAHAEYKASFVKGGSMHPLIYGTHLTAITEEKIKSLTDEFAIMLRRNNIH